MVDMYVFGLIANPQANSSSYLLTHTYYALYKKPYTYIGPTRGSYMDGPIRAFEVRRASFLRFRFKMLIDFKRLNNNIQGEPVSIVHRAYCL